MFKISIDFDAVRDLIETSMDRAEGVAVTTVFNVFGALNDTLMQGLDHVETYFE